ncbi:MAG: serine/threonine-protein phosphatase [Chloroflexi bacterium]|nr:serine/threonine-protein phosphatase [Chloroflexota bacterium]
MATPSTSAADSLSLNVREATDIGLRRESNEDRTGWLSGDQMMGDALGVLVVADGMGGHIAGGDAASIAVEAVISALRVSSDYADSGSTEDAVTDALHSANSAVNEAAKISQQPGMGTTLTVCIVSPARLIVGNVGDSRAYLLSGQEFRRLTQDDNVVSQQVAAGLITEAEAKYHPKRNVLTQAIGPDVSISPAISTYQTGESDRILLCSDGLHGVLDDQVIEHRLRTGQPAEAARNLVQEAVKAGGADNITVLVADIVRGRNAGLMQRLAGRLKWRLRGRG